jgi:hypothetical protein
MVMYMCARGIVFASVYEFVDWILELFQQCGIFFFIVLHYHILTLKDILKFRCQHLLFVLYIKTQ